MKKILKIVGIIILVFVGWFVFDVVKNSIRINKEMTEVQEIERTDDGVYESQYGWKMKVPVGWGRTENKGNKMEMLVVADKKMGDNGWTYVAVEPFARVEEVDKGGFLEKYEDALVKMYPNVKVVKESVEGIWRGAKNYDYLLDHDGLEEMRFRQFRRYLFHPKGGGGWLIYSQAKAEDWEKLEPVIMGMVNSFGTLGTPGE